MRYITPLRNIDLKDISSVGGKAASLGVMIANKLPVPVGFALTTQAHKDYSGKNFDQKLIKEIHEGISSLTSATFAVRSSAVMEDSANDSWAGQFESYLNISTNDIVSKVKQCWNSLSSDRALQYAEGKHVEKSMGVIIQEMVQSDISGVVFTRNPVDVDSDELIIESTYGLGEILVQGRITPDTYIVNRGTSKITKNLSDKEEMISFKGGKNKVIRVPKEKVNITSLSNQQIKMITDLALDVEHIFKSPQDIEWAISKGKLYILQSRPITTI